jgi:hypothetical protein
MPNDTVTVTYDPNVPGRVGISPTTLTLTTRNVNISFNLINSPGFKFVAFTPQDPEHQLQWTISDTTISVLDTDKLPEIIKYTVEIQDASGRQYNSDPQLINNPKVSET